MSDVIDQANDRAEAFLADALEQQQRRAMRESGQAESNDCSCCGEPIPQARREALPGVATCTPCQQQLEHAQALYRRPD